MVVVRLATESDSAEAEALTSAVFAALRAIYVPVVTPDKSATADGRWTRIVAIDDARIVGTLHCQFRERSVHVKAVAVRADCRRRGVARQLLEFVADGARRRGLGSVTLYTLKQTGNVPVFQRLGFHVVREEEDPMVTLSGGGIALDVLMERQVV
jgi:N-acetylglutamate synthase-like GNAT family acetyltransferase